MKVQFPGDQQNVDSGSPTQWQVPDNREVALCDEDGLPELISKSKATIVARGFFRAARLDYDKSFAPTARQSTPRTVLACGVQQVVKLRQLDIETPCPNARIDEES